jgi:hypothetical protein
MRRRSGGQHSLEPLSFDLPINRKARSYFVRFRTRGQHSLEPYQYLYRMVVLSSYGGGDIV